VSYELNSEYVKKQAQHISGKYGDSCHCLSKTLRQPVRSKTDHTFDKPLTANETPTVDTDVESKLIEPKWIRPQPCGKCKEFPYLDTTKPTAAATEAEIVEANCMHCQDISHLKIQNKDGNVFKTTKGGHIT
jgi:hypothetical protein